MKQKIALLFTAFLLFEFAQAQVSKESFEKAVDLLNCKTVEFALKGSNKNDVEKQFKEKCKCLENPKFSLIKLSIPNSETKTIQLADEINKLKEEPFQNLQKDEAVSFLSVKIFSNSKYEKIVAFANNPIRKDKPEFTSYIEDLNINLSKILFDNVSNESDLSTTKSFQQPIMEKRVTELEINQNNKKNDTWIFSGLVADILILFSILLGVIALLLGLIKRSGNDNKVSNEIKNYVKTKINDAERSRITPNNNNSSAELRDANNRIRYLEEDIKKLNEKINIISPLSKNTLQTTQPTIQEGKQSEIRPEILFLSSPNSNGSFDESSASTSYKEGATIYRFTKTGNNKASFQIDEKEASVKLALQYRDKRIDPVCEAVNAFNQAKKISTIQQGEAELQNGVWKVNKKAKIRYEN